MFYERRKRRRWKTPCVRIKECSLSLPTESGGIMNSSLFEISPLRKCIREFTSAKLPQHLRKIKTLFNNHMNHFPFHLQFPLYHHQFGMKNFTTILLNNIFKHHQVGTTCFIFDRNKTNSFSSTRPLTN